MCGIVGLIGTPEAAKEAFLGLTTLQHRGQDGAGILTHDSAGFHHVRNLGLVESVFTKENMESLAGQAAIGHARYATVGRGSIADVQPFLLSYPFGIGLVHNGNVVNFEELGEELRNKWHRSLLTQSDSEVILNFLAKGLSKYADQGQTLSFEQICEAVGEIYSRVKGSYSVVAMIGGQGLLAFRDPHGLRPLSVGMRSGRRKEEGQSYMFASESVALAFNGYQEQRSLEPGEVVFIDNAGNYHSKVVDSRKSRPCMFEWVYFSSPESVLDKVPVYGARIELGRHLAKLVNERLEQKKIQPDVIVPVPETSRIAAISLAEEIGLPYREVLIKNRYIKRTFILDSQEKRKKAVSLKLSPVRSEIRGKKVLLVDDSIVRGTTSRKLVELVREAGAKEVYFVSTCPPIKHPCFYGIDFPNGSELIAHGRSQAEIEKEMGADAVIYMSMDGLRAAISDASEAVNFERPCMACLDGRYPSDVTAGARFTKTRERDRAAVKGREGE